MAPDQDGEGNITGAAEHFGHFIGGSRSFPVATRTVGVPSVGHRPSPYQSYFVSFMWRRGAGMSTATSIQAQRPTASRSISPQRRRRGHRGPMPPPHRDREQLIPKNGVCSLGEPSRHIGETDCMAEEAVQP
jgi:hypothetical protein